MWQNNQSVNSSDTSSNDIPLDRGAKLYMGFGDIDIGGCHTSDWRCNIN